MKSASNIILIIDDNEDNQYTFGRYLRQSDFEVWKATTGKEGLALAEKQPSLIILDIQLPDISGYDLCRTLKSEPGTASIPVLQTSAAFTESSDRAHGLDEGADAYLIQPIDAQELIATVRSLLRIRKAESAARLLASQWQTTFDCIGDALCLVDPQGKIERFNRAFHSLFPEAIKGQLLNVVLMAAVSRDPRNAVRQNLQAQTAFELVLQKRWHRISSNPITDHHGQTLGNAWVFSDINSIREAELKLQNVNQDLEQRVTERTVSLREAIHQMEQFSYTVSHDLRAPLRAMQGYSNALIEDFPTTMPSDATNYLQRIADNAARLDKMIIDVLTFTRVSKGAALLSMIPLSKIVHDVIEHYPGLKEPAASITVNVRHSVLANESGLLQAISNLLGNAVKFVAQGITPKIHIWSEARGHDVRLWIEDNGIGISPEYQHRLFGMFERVLPATSDYEGTGVGLAITRKAIERMGGSVGMESDGEHGSKFWIQLAGAKVEEPVPQK
ncbi:MAG: ATP-binding protein [Candidatus Methylacidiphilales bacterium]|nr:ATP-binding protein [Candidatus Methylacidiphilales bacterium]